jgi:hypothetical protein
MTNEFRQTGVIGTVTGVPACLHACLDGVVLPYCVASGSVPFCHTACVKCVK